MKRAVAKPTPRKHLARAKPKRGRITYPFVTTGGGGGALPLPIWALAVTLRRASTAAVVRASFFMKDPFS
jgi:hypothetical protein